MDAVNEQVSGWSSTQAYVMAVVCLLLGGVVGWLIHAPKTAVPTAQTQVANPGDGAHSPSPDDMKRMAERTAEPLLAAVQKNPNDAEALAKVGSVYFRTQQFPQAVEYYERALKVKPDAEGYVSLSNAYHYAGFDDRAMDALNSALKLDPKSANALFNLGMLQWRVNGDPKAAIDSWQRLLKANPNHPGRKQVEAYIAKAKEHMNMPAEKKTDKPAM